MEKRSKDNKDNKGIHEPEGVVVFIKEDAFEDVRQGGSKGFATRNKIREWGVSVGDCKEETDNIPDEVGNKESFDAASEFLFVEGGFVITEEGNTGDEEEKGNGYGTEVVGEEITDKTGGGGEVVGWNLILIGGRVVNSNNEKDSEKGKNGFFMPKVVKFDRHVILPWK